MFLTILNAEIVICIFSYYSEKKRQKLYFQISPIFLFYLFIYFFSGGGGVGIRGVLSMCMQVILDSLFGRQGSGNIGDGKKGEFRDWTSLGLAYRRR